MNKYYSRDLKYNFVVKSQRENNKDQFIIDLSSYYKYYNKQIKEKYNP